MLQELVWGAFGLAVGGAVVWLVAKAQRTTNQALTQRMDQITRQLDQRLQENVRAINESKSFLADRVSSTERTAREVSLGLGKLETATSALKVTTDEISNFQNLLKSPKVRGSFGEVLLNNILADVLPHDRYQTQFTLPSTGEIADAIIKLQDGHIVAVDSKFPLANYEQYVHAEDLEVKKRARAAVVRDIKKHVTDISKKYIAPQDHTLDYAFMYIPFEGVYYETIVHDGAGESLWEYCLHHKIVPVSPNSFLAYLHTILVGLRGMKIEQQAKEILQHLGQVRQDFKQFNEDFSMVGKHIGNAKNRYEDSARRLDKLDSRLDQIETGSDSPGLPEKSRESNE